MFRSSSSSAGEINGFLDAGSHMKGELQFDDTFRIEGKLTGGVVSDGELIIGERGEVDGDIEAARIFVSGLVRGTLRAKERIVVTSSGKVFADLYTPVLTVEEGALLEGHCHMQTSSLEKAAADKAKSRTDKIEKVTPMPGTQRGA